MNLTAIPLASAVLCAIPLGGVGPQSTCPAAQARAGSEHDIVETALAAGSFETLAAALEAGGLVHALQGEGPFTVFAPTDAAFAKLPADTLAVLLEPENKQLLVDILTYHVVSGSVPASQIATLSSATTLNGQRVDVHVGEEGVRLDGAGVETTDIRCSNGIIHVIDTVLMPETRNLVEVAAAGSTFGTLVAAATAADLAEVLSGEGPFTVFAPTDAAFEALPAGTLAGLLEPEGKQQLIRVLQQHVVPGRVFGDQALAAGGAETLLGQRVQVEATEAGVRIGAATLLAADIQASNGVIHAIDAVLLPE